jgi:transposase
MLSQLEKRIATLEKECERIPILEKECERIPILEKEIELRDEKIKDLEKRLNINSTNSHSAPSRDPIKIKAAKQRVKGGKRGGQKNHKGTTLNKSENVDQFKEYKPKDCECGVSLTDLPSKVHDTRQEYDIQINHIIIEHQRHSIICPCCKKVNKGVYPENIKAETQYGPNIKAFSLLCNAEYKLPYGKLSEMIKAVFKLNISEGTLCNFVKKGSENLVQVESEIKQELLKAEVLHADETGIIVDLKLKWMHVLSNSQYTYLRIEDNRGENGFDEIISTYKGHLIHDFFKSYFKLENCSHHPCGSHITRELDALIDEQSKWAQNFKNLYYELYHEDWEKNQEKRKIIERRYKRILNAGILEEPEPCRRGSRGRLKKSKGLNLILRLKSNMAEVLEFAFNRMIPFTNNQAERDLRHGKVKQKVSGCFRSLNGAQDYARIISVISTLKKQSFDVFQSLVTMFRYNSLTLCPE